MWYLIQSPRLPPPALQSLTPVLCLWTMPPSPTLHYRLPQVRKIHSPRHTVPCCWWIYLSGTFSACVTVSHALPLPLVEPVLVFNWNYHAYYSASLVCVYLNKYGKVGPHLDQQRIQQLPDHFGPGRASSVLQQCVQACVDAAHNQGTVFSCLKSGQGGEVISGGHLFQSFHVFPVVESCC